MRQVYVVKNYDSMVAFADREAALAVKDLSINMALYEVPIIDVDSTYLDLMDDGADSEVESDGL